MTETERNSRFDDHEPVLGHERWYKVLWYRLCLLLIVDVLSKAFVFFAIMTYIAYFLLPHASGPIGIGILLMWCISALNWTIRKYVGPFIEAICSLVKGLARPTLESPRPDKKPKLDDES